MTEIQNPTTGLIETASAAAVKIADYVLNTRERRTMTTRTEVANNVLKARDALSRNGDFAHDFDHSIWIVCRELGIPA